MPWRSVTLDEQYPIFAPLFGISVIYAIKSIRPRLTLHPSIGSRRSRPRARGLRRRFAISRHTPSIAWFLHSAPICPIAVVVLVLSGLLALLLLLLLLLSGLRILVVVHIMIVLRPVAILLLVDIVSLRVLLVAVVGVLLEGTMALITLVVAGLVVSIVLCVEALRCRTMLDFLISSSLTIVRHSVKQW